MASVRYGDGGPGLRGRAMTGGGVPGPGAPGLDTRDLAAIAACRHDLYAALAGLTDHLRLIGPGQIDAAAQLHLTAALYQAETMGRLIGGALSHLTGDLVEAPAPVDLDDLLHGLAMVFADAAALRGARLDLHRDALLPPHLLIDRLTLERVLRNLIGHAITHVEGQGIEVRLAPSGPLRLGLTICYDHPPNAALPSAALPVPRGEQAGSGLGLGIVAGLVEDLGGSWGFGNPEAGGARVWVDLPYVPVDPADDGALLSASPAAPAGQVAGQVVGRLSGHAILAMDDNDTVLHHLARLLGDEGAMVDCARTGAEGVARLQARSYDLLIVDATLPDIRGAKVIAALRARPGAGGLAPALAMTADTRAAGHDELIAAGASRVVTKPLPDPAEMLRIVERLVKAAPAPVLPPASPPPATTTPADPDADLPLFDPEPLRRVFALAGAMTSREILERLVIDLTETLGRLDSAGQRSDVMELRAASHVLIALAGTAGAMRLLARTQALNHRIHAGASLSDLRPMLAEVRLLTQGAIAAITRLPLPAVPRGPQPT